MATKGTQVTKLTKEAVQFIDKNLPTICTAGSVLATVAAVVLASDAGAEAASIIEEYAKDHDLEAKDVPIAEKVRLTWKCYAKAAAAAGTSAGLAIAANHVNLKRITALGAAYSIADTKLREYKEHVTEKLGEKSEKVVRDDIAHDMVTLTPMDTVLNTGQGNTLCYDCVSGRYFMSSVEAIRQAANTLNYAMFSEMNETLNYFYELINLPEVKIGDMLGWNVDDPLNVNFHAVLKDEHTPVIAIEYDLKPINEFAWP